MNKKIALVFPGQGSQSIGMLNELAKDYPSIKQWYQIASEVLDYNLWQLIQNGPEEVLNKTTYTQPAMLVAGYCVWLLWQEQSEIKPTLFAGHSLGEYTALLCANVFDFADAVKLVSLRGTYMQEAVPEGYGAMAAIVGLSDEAVIELCQKVVQNEEILIPANFNSPGQIVIAGHSKAVERAIESAHALGAKLARKLAMSVPSHCQLMKPAAEKLAQTLNEIVIRVPEFPVVNNVDVKINSDPTLIKDALVRQLYSPVRWVEVVLAMKEQGITTLIEAGPGRVLAGLNKRIDRSLEVLSIYDTTTLQNALVTSTVSL